MEVAVRAFGWRSDRRQVADRRKRTVSEVIDPKRCHDRLRRRRRLRRLFANIDTSPKRAASRLTSEEDHATNVMRVHERARKGSQ